MKKAELKEAIELLKQDIKASVRRNHLIGNVEIIIKVVKSKHKKIESGINCNLNTGHYD